MPHIHVLSPHIANQIAAGEVVERPASVVKELVENSIDAGASAISIEIDNGGIDRIRVVDNGCGIPASECETAFLRHATSKLSSAEDLLHIDTLGFRGEALASIAAVSCVTLVTKTADEELGTRITIDNGIKTEEKAVAAMQGTSLEVLGLFGSVPARRKFLKSPRAEAGAIGDYIARMLMVNPSVAFHFTSNGKTVYQTMGDGQLLHAVLSVYGTGVLPSLAEVHFDNGYIRVTGFVGTSEISRQNRSHQSFFLNGRYIRSNALSNAVLYAFDTRLMSGRFPFAVLMLTVASSDVDVNVHPTKMEVRFVDEQRVVRAVTAACADALNKKHAPVYAAPQDTAHTNRIPLDSLPHIDLRRPTEHAGKYVKESSFTHVARPIPTGAGQVQRYIIPARTEVSPDRLPPEKTEETPLFDAPYTIVGVLFDTYWIVQQGENIFLIDQHAAHERRNYEAFMHEETANISQRLLTPHVISLQPSDADALRAHLESFTAIGYELSFTGENEVTLYAVPQVRGEALPDRFFFDALHQAAEFGHATDKTLMRDAIIQSACKHAIKAGERMDASEIETLLSYFSREGAPLTCPHGRPVLVRLDRLAIEKMFKRVL